MPEPEPVWDALISPRIEINTAQLLRMAFVERYHTRFLDDVKEQVQEFYDVRGGGKDRCSPVLQLFNVHKFETIRDLCSHDISHAVALLQGPTKDMVVFSSVLEMFKNSGDRTSVGQVQSLTSTIEDFCSFSNPSLDVVKRLEGDLGKIAQKLQALSARFTTESRQGDKWNDLSTSQDFFTKLQQKIAGQRMRMFTLADQSVMSSLRDLYVELMRRVEEERKDEATLPRLQVIADLLTQMSKICAEVNETPKPPAKERMRRDLKAVRQVRDLTEQLTGLFATEDRVCESFVRPVFNRLAMTPDVSLPTEEALCRAAEAYLLDLGDSVMDALTTCGDVRRFFEKSIKPAGRPAESDKVVSSLIKNIQEREASISVARRPDKDPGQHTIVLDMIGASLANLLSDLVFVAVNGRRGMYRIEFNIKRVSREPPASLLPLNIQGLDDAYVTFAQARFVDRVKERQRQSMRMDIFRLVFQKSFLPCMTVVVPGQKEPLRFMHDILRQDAGQWTACDDMDMQLAPEDLKRELKERFKRLSEDPELVNILTAYHENEEDFQKRDPFKEVLMAAVKCFLALNATSNNALSFASEKDFGWSVDWKQVIEYLKSVCPDWYSPAMISAYLVGVIADEPNRARRYVIYKHNLERLGVRTWNILREAKKKFYSWSGGASSAPETTLAESWSRQWRQDFQLYLELTDANIFRLRSDTSRRLAGNVGIPEWIFQDLVSGT